MPNLLKNSGFENSLTKVFANWRGWYLHPQEGAVCVYQKKVANARTGFYQDVPGKNIKSNGKYKWQLKLLSPTAGATVSPTVWVFKKGQDPQPTQKTFKLKVGKWQVIQIDVPITRKNLKKVRAELYFGPTNAEVIIQRAYFGK
ncbi:MAG: hypothetical protein AAFZ58_02435 [Pseudomonadota bacterium]